MTFGIWILTLRWSTRSRMKTGQFDCAFSKHMYSALFNKWDHVEDNVLLVGFRILWVNVDHLYKCVWANNNNIALLYHDSLIAILILLDVFYVQKNNTICTYIYGIRHYDGLYVLIAAAKRKIKFQIWTHSFDLNAEFHEFIQIEHFWYPWNAENRSISSMF